MQELGKPEPSYWIHDMRLMLENFELIRNLKFVHGHVRDATKALAMTISWTGDIISILTSTILP